MWFIYQDLSNAEEPIKKKLNSSRWSRFIYQGHGFKLARFAGGITCSDTVISRPSNGHRCLWGLHSMEGSHSFRNIGAFIFISPPVYLGFLQTHSVSGLQLPLQSVMFCFIIHGMDKRPQYYIWTHICRCTSMKLWFCLFLFSSL